MLWCRPTLALRVLQLHGKANALIMHVIVTDDFWVMKRWKRIEWSAVHIVETGKNKSTTWWHMSNNGAKQTSTYSAMQMPWLKLRDLHLLVAL